MDFTLILTLLSSILISDCALNHFAHNSSCPRCKKSLGNDDVWELAVADPKNARKNQESSTQDLFTKASRKQSSVLAFSDLCHSMIRQIDNSRSNAIFLLKQMNREMEHQARRSGSSNRDFQSLTQANAHLSKELANHKLRYKEDTAKLQSVVQNREATIRQLERKLQAMSMSSSNSKNHMIGSSSNHSRSGSAGQQGLGMFQQNSNPASSQAFRSHSMPQHSSRQGPLASISQNTMHRRSSNHHHHHSMQSSSRPFSDSGSHDSGSLGRVRHNVSGVSNYSFAASTTSHVSKRRRGGGGLHHRSASESPKPSQNPYHTAMMSSSGVGGGGTPSSNHGGGLNPFTSSGGGRYSH